MKPKYLEPDTRSRDRWIISYMDVLTILLIFFIAVAANAPAKTEPAPPPPPTPVQAAPTPPSPLAEAEKALAERGLDVHREARGVVISLPQTILFASGDDRVSPDAFPMVEKVVEVIRLLPNRVMLVGHADAVPIHNRHFKNNWELSAARGLRLLEVLNENYGIAESRLSVSSDGANRPKNSNDTPDGRANNRRVEIVILDENVTSM